MYNRYLLHVAIYAALSALAGVAASVAFDRAVATARKRANAGLDPWPGVVDAPPVVDVSDVDQLADDTPEGAA